MRAYNSMARRLSLEHTLLWQRRRPNAAANQSNAEPVAGRSEWPSFVWSLGKALVYRRVASKQCGSALTVLYAQ